MSRSLKPVIRLLLNAFVILAGFLCCTAVQGQTLGQTYVVDSSEAMATANGYSHGWAATSGTWESISTFGGYGGSYMWVSSYPETTESSQWKFRAAPGFYDIYLTWTNGHSGAISAAATGGSGFAQQSYSGQNPQADKTIGGRPFKKMGTIVIPSMENDSQVTITTHVTDWNTPNADAIAYVRTADAPAPYKPTETINEQAQTIQVDWNWNEVDGGAPNLLQIYRRRRLLSGGAWSSWDMHAEVNFTTSPQSVTYSILPLYQTQFRYRWMTFNQGTQTVTWQSSWREGEPFAVAMPDPAAPKDLFAFVMSKSKIKLEWRDQSGPEAVGTQETGFEIWHSAGDGSGTFALLATVGQGITEFTHEGLTPGSQHSYKVRAVRATAPTAQSAFAGPVTRSTAATGSHDSGLGTNGVKTHVSGLVGVRDRSMHVRSAWMSWTDPRRPDVAATSPAGYATVGGGARRHALAGHRQCGKRELVFAAEFSYPETVSAEQPDGFYMVRWFKITVGRNGKMLVESSPDYIPVPLSPEDVLPGYLSNGGGPAMLNWDSDFDGYNDNLTAPTAGLGPQGVVFYPAMLKALVDDAGGTWDPDYANGLGHPTEMTDAERAHSQMWRDFAALVYQSMTEGNVNWASIIPRCPGEDLDGYDTGGTGGGGTGGGGYDPGSYSPINDPFEMSQPNLPSEKERLKFATVDFDREVSSIYDINGAGWWPGWSIGDATWQIDLRNPFGTGALGEAVNTMRIAWRYCLFAILLVIGLRELVLSLQQV